MDTAFFILSKLAGFVLMVETWLAVGLGLAFLGGLRGARRLVVFSAGPALATLLAVGFLPLGDLLLRPLEAAFPPRPAPEHIDGIVVLGGVEAPRETLYWDQPQLNAAAERLTAAAALAIAEPGARVVFSGGSGRLRDTIAGQPDLPPVAVQVLASLGVDAARILWEDRSRNTAENARLSYALAAPAPGETWVLVTSAFHMGRSMASFRAAGWGDIVPYPVDYRTGGFASGIGWGLSGNLAVLNTAIREWVGRIAYRVTGR